MQLNEYQKLVVETDPFPTNYQGDLAVLMSIASEAGEVLDVEKKKIGRKVSYEQAQKQKFIELGDVLWGIAVYAHRIGYTLEDIAKAQVKKAQTKSGYNTYDAETMS